MLKRDAACSAGPAALRMLRRIVCALALSVAACAPSPIAQSDNAAAIRRTEAESPARGLAYAKQACASCHAVTASEAHSPDLAAPTFEAIANTPGMTGIALNAWLHTPHRTMPNLIVDPDRIADLSAYISTLKRANSPGGAE
jgi:mono/diheme cytochrome c family protein